MVEAAPYRFQSKLLRRWSRLAVVLFMIASTALLMLFFGQPETSSSVEAPTRAVAITLGLLALTIAIIWWMEREMNQVEVRLDSVGIERKNGAQIEQVAYPQIQRLIAYADRTQHVHAIRLKTPKGEWLLQGMENLESLFGELRGRLDGQRIQQARWLPDTALWLAMFAVGITTQFIANVYYPNSFFEEFSSPILIILAGAVFLFDRPATKAAGPRVRFVENVLGFGMIAVGITGALIVLLG